MRGDEWVGGTFERLRGVGYGVDGYGCFYVEYHNVSDR